ncbi:FAD-dependent oxidoreductase, partial [Tateyamaria sp.]|nr:FAD-dependent oxidoreductase [Tateyamaria sp.]
MKSLHTDVPVCYNCPVLKVDYTKANIQISTQNGTLRTQQVISTVSTGVLGSEIIKFHPPLPNEKTA